MNNISQVTAPRLTSVTLNTVELSYVLCSRFDFEEYHRLACDAVYSGRSVYQCFGGPLTLWRSVVTTRTTCPDMQDTAFSHRACLCVRLNLTLNTIQHKNDCCYLWRRGVFCEVRTECFVIIYMLFGLQFRTFIRIQMRSFNRQHFTNAGSSYDSIVKARVTLVEIFFV
jgi:hypothetical protein